VSVSAHAPPVASASAPASAPPVAPASASASASASAPPVAPAAPAAPAPVLDPQEVVHFDWSVFPDPPVSRIDPLCSII
jgi:hypothetical protein